MLQTDAVWQTASVSAPHTHWETALVAGILFSPSKGPPFDGQGHRRAICFVWGTRAGGEFVYAVLGCAPTLIAGRTFVSKIGNEHAPGIH